MKIFLNENEVLELACDYLDLSNPNPDKLHDIAQKMDMEYNEELDMFEDVEEVSIRKYRRLVNLKDKLQKAFGERRPDNKEYWHSHEIVTVLNTIQ